MSSEELVDEKLTELEGSTPEARLALVERLFRENMETYRHHFDLYIKGVAVYLAVLGASTAYIFQESTVPEAKAALSVFVALVAVGGMMGSLSCRIWVNRMAQLCDGFCQELEVPPFPFGASARIVSVIAALSAVVVILGIGNLGLIVFSGI